MSDARVDYRIRLPSDIPGQLGFALRGERHVARIVDLTEGGMRVVFDSERVAIARGAQLAECTIEIPSLLISQPLDVLAVEEVGIEDGSTVLRLASEHAATRARLWLALAAIEHVPLPSNDDAESRQRDHRGIPKVPARGVTTESARLERLEFARSTSGAPLSFMQDTTLSAERLTKNIEAFIGGVEVPVGLAGPLLFRGVRAKGLILAPFATTEGALVASATRGATALSRSGGVTTRVLHQRMVRAPAFVFRDVGSAFLFARWIETHHTLLSLEVQKVSGHCRLTGIEPYVVGRIAHVVFQFETGDAAGQNMTTSATWRACQWVLDQLRALESIKLEHFQIDANMSGDKKVSAYGFMRGRGFRAVADCHIPRHILQDVLKVTPELLLRANDCFVSGTLQGGHTGYTINASNVLGAIFTATGQDIACVAESSPAILSVQPSEHGIYASIVLPCLAIGAVGGGTHLPRQRELLEMMGCVGEGATTRLAEIIAGYALGLDLSTLAAIASDQFVSAHEKLGRNRPVKWLQREDLSTGFFARSATRMFGDETATVTSADPIGDYAIGSSIITELTGRKINKLVGLLPYRVRADVGGRTHERDVMVKVKPLSDEVALAIKGVSVMCSPTLAKAYARLSSHTELAGCDERELAVYGQSDARFREHIPAVYDLYEDRSREAFVIVMELLKDAVLLDSVDEPSAWRRKELEAAIDGASAFHSVWLGRERELLEQPWIGLPPSTKRMVESTPLWIELAQHAAQEFPEWFTREDLLRMRNLIVSASDWWPILERQSRTLIHNDFNPRNICFRAEGGGLRLVAYDWELSTLHAPQHDLAELLVFTQSDRPDRAEIDHYVDYHRRCLERASGREIDPAEWREGFRYSLCDLAIKRIALYIMAHTVRDYRFMERIFRTLRALLDLEQL